MDGINTIEKKPKFRKTKLMGRNKERRELRRQRYKDRKERADDLIYGLKFELDAISLQIAVPLVFAAFILFWVKLCQHAILGINASLLSVIEVYLLLLLAFALIAKNDIYEYVEQQLTVIGVIIFSTIIFCIII